MNPAIINTTTGEGLFFTGTLAASTDYLEIDTQQGSVLINGWNPADNYLNETISRFIRLAPGANSIQIAANSGTTGTSKSVVSWRNT